MLQLGGREVHVRWLGGGHTQGDAAVWLPKERVLFAGDLVEARAAPYMGDALVAEWTSRNARPGRALAPKTSCPGAGRHLRRPGRSGNSTRRADYAATILSTVRGAPSRGASLRGAGKEAPGGARAALRRWCDLRALLPLSTSRVATTRHRGSSRRCGPPSRTGGVGRPSNPDRRSGADGLTPRSSLLTSTAPTVVLDAKPEPTRAGSRAIVLARHALESFVRLGCGCADAREGRRALARPHVLPR